MNVNNNTNGLKGVKNPSWTCPNCKKEEATFSSQREMVKHALACKQNQNQGRGGE